MKKYILLFVLFNSCLINLSSQDNIFRGTGHPAINKNFNLLVHIPVDSTTRERTLSSSYIDSVLFETQKYFEPIGVTFDNCETNIIENYTFNNFRDSLRITEMKVLYGKPHRINVYFLKTIPFAYCGTSTFNGITTPDDAHIFLESTCIDGHVLQLAHHMGHLFGLKDTYANNDELVDGSNCDVAGDEICDTPADPFLKGIIIPYDDEQYTFAIRLLNLIEDCEFRSTLTDSNGDLFTPDITNIMSAYPCKCKFTDNQLRKIVENYKSSSIKQF